MKSKQLQIRVSEEEKRRIREAAAREGMDLTTYVLSRVLPDESAQFFGAVESVSDEAQRSYALAAVADLLEGLTPGEFSRATRERPPLPSEPLWANYIAAMTETAAYRKRVAPPTWTHEVVPLTDPWFASKMKSLRLHLLRASPPAFRRRNLFVDATLGDRV